MTDKIAIIDLYGDECGTICMALETADAENPICSSSGDCNVNDKTIDDTEMEKQVVRSVLGQLAKKGYTKAIFSPNSELQPKWMKSMLKNWKP
jgi:hypothetical protein